MTLIKNYNYSEKEISLILTDNTNGEYVWVGFKTDGTECKLQKLSAHNPLQKYFEVDVSVNEIKAGIISGSYLYVAVDDTNLILNKYQISNPLSSTTEFIIPSGINEAPIDILINTDVYLLTPGAISGQNAKIIRMTTSGSYVETIDLSTVFNASSFTVDSATNDFWVVTNTDPAHYIRVYETSGGGYNYTSNL